MLEHPFPHRTSGYTTNTLFIPSSPNNFLTSTCSSVWPSSPPASAPCSPFPRSQKGTPLLQLAEPTPAMVPSTPPASVPVVCSTRRATSSLRLGTIFSITTPAIPVETRTTTLSVAEVLRRRTKESPSQSKLRIVARAATRSISTSPLPHSTDLRPRALAVFTA